MIVLGVVLVVLAVVVVLAAVFGGSDEQVALDLGVVSIDSSVLGVFLLGAATLLVLVAGLELMRQGARRGYARRKELRNARKVVKEDEQRSSGKREGDQGNPPPA